jgi:hypothetical protein
MQWALAWFSCQEDEWKRRAHRAEIHHKRGHECYANKQVMMWKKMHDTAEDAWSTVLRSK